MTGDATEERRGRERVGRYQRERRVNLRIALASYTLDTAWLCCWWMLGVVPGWLVAAYAAAAVAASAVFDVLIASGRNLGFKDPSMTTLQSGAGYALQIAGLTLAPQVGAMFLMTTFIGAAFASLSMTVRQFIGHWGLVGLATGVAMLLAGGGFGMPGGSPYERVLAWLVFLSVLARVVFLCFRVGVLRDRLIRRNAELRASITRIEHLASLDELTQALNRRAFGGLVTDEVRRAARTGEPFCMLFFDLDHFKRINDRFGHQIGDAVLKRFAALTSETVRATDRVGRWGGEEFAVLLPATALEGGMTIAERVRAAIESEPWERVAPGLALTVSGGVAERAPEEDAGHLFARLDAALYAAKNGGRNRIQACAPASGEA